MTGSRPARLVCVAGTGTDIGKTWVAAHTLSLLRRRGLRVAARKPVQSFSPADSAATDARQLSTATGEADRDVCPAHRCYPLALAPPMAAEELKLPAFTLAELVSEIDWPQGVDVGLVETVGGTRSPICHDADSADLCAALAPDLLVLVADAGLGTINAVRSSTASLHSCRAPVVVMLNRFDAGTPLHDLNRSWLSQRDSLCVVTGYEELAALVAG